MVILKPAGPIVRTAVGVEQEAIIRRNPIISIRIFNRIFKAAAAVPRTVIILINMIVFIVLSAPIKALHRTDVLNRIFKRIMDDDTVTQYYLRHTFSTVCQQYVRPDIVDIWMGDSSERLVGRVYTHFSDNFMIKQMQNVVFDF